MSWLLASGSWLLPTTDHRLLTLSTLLGKLVHIFGFIILLLSRNPRRGRRLAAKIEADSQKRALNIAHFAARASIAAENSRRRSLAKSEPQMNTDERGLKDSNRSTSNQPPLAGLATDGFHGWKTLSAELMVCSSDAESWQNHAARSIVCRNPSGAHMPTRTSVMKKARRRQPQLPQFDASPVGYCRVGAACEAVLVPARRLPVGHIPPCGSA